MKPLLIALLLAGSAVACFAQGQHYVPAYYRSDGRFVPAHYQTNANNNFYDNWSTRGNFNPFTGQPGYISQPPARPWIPARAHHAAYYDRFGVYHPAE